ncbi:MAG TPA: phenylalanine--tRNA ligase subunit alpha [Candidatus Limiplasma stercoravium]|nr:phenylalanine--tRNA ligase subunit alpha [Candidatus Limiplasma stercoravium]
MEQNLRQLSQRVERELESLKSSAELEALRVRILGKKGELTAMLKALGGLPPQERPRMGALINDERQRLTARMDEAQARLQAAERLAAIQSETIDVTEPRPLPRMGSEHPITLVMNELIDCFSGMGFEVMEGPEVELDHYNFELMNLPKNHPARDAQDTFYMDDNIVLRTHTSPMQARAMLTRKPPIRIICPGRVYRADEVDATHSPVFHQMEGLVVDEHVRMSDLRGTLEAFAKKLYGPTVEIRFRPSFFPFTEPSAEVDLTCTACHGKGCGVCKGTGWVEVLGCGMVNPKVLDMCGIDSARYSGFAFGIGLERIAMKRYGIRDMRLLFEGDARLLGQLR